MYKTVDLILYLENKNIMTSTSVNRMIRFKPVKQSQYISLWESWVSCSWPSRGVMHLSTTTFWQDIDIVGMCATLGGHFIICGRLHRATAHESFVIVICMRVCWLFALSMWSAALNIIAWYGLAKMMPKLAVPESDRVWPGLEPVLLWSRAECPKHSTTCLHIARTWKVDPQCHLVVGDQTPSISFAWQGGGCGKCSWLGDRHPLHTAPSTAAFQLGLVLAL
jgi:hypothetical protein